MRRRSSLGTRLTLLLSGAASLALAALGLVTLWALDGHFQAQDRGTLHSHFQQARGLLAQVQDDATREALPGRFQAAFASHADLAVRVQQADGRVLFEQNTVAIPPQMTRQPARAHPVTTTKWRDGERAWRGSAMTMPSSVAGAAPLTVAMALDTHHHDTFIANFRRALLGYVLLTAIGCALLAWWAVRRGLRPLGIMRAKATRIGGGDLDERMPVDEGPAELAGLAAALNSMLQRLQADFDRLTAFSSDIAHELRTPLSNLLMQTHVVLSQPRSGAEYRDVLASNAEELERLSRTVADMLLLAKADHGQLLPSREPVALDDAVRALFDFHEALAEDRGVALHLTGAATVPGDRLMLRRAIHNLLSNALRHTPRGGVITVRIDQPPGQARLTVRNDGMPIAPEVLARLFERFYRAEQDRSHADGEGSGLGLAITQAIVRAHAGSVRAFSDRSGNILEIVLPAQVVEPDLS